MLSQSMPEHAWVFRANVERVVDGDTIDLHIDQGMHCRRIERVRLLGVNCPEVRGPSRAAGQAATHYTNNWLQIAMADYEVDWPLYLRTEKDPDVFGRYLAVIWRVFDSACLNTDLLSAGHAVVT